jgi:hypothetical protein
MRADIGRARTVSSRGKSKQRSIKQKRRPKFPVRKRGTKLVTKVRQSSVMII